MVTNTWKGIIFYKIKGDMIILNVFINRSYNHCKKDKSRWSNGLLGGQIIFPRETSEIDSCFHKVNIRLSINLIMPVEIKRIIFMIIFIIFHEKKRMVINGMELSFFYNKGRNRWSNKTSHSINSLSSILQLWRFHVLPST